MRANLSSGLASAVTGAVLCSAAPVTVAGTIEQYSSTDNAVLIATPAIKDCESQEIIVPLAGTNEDCRIGQILVATGLLVRSGGYLRREDARDISCRDRR
jgi:hypothetical protein